MNFNFSRRHAHLESTTKMRKEIEEIIFQKLKMKREVLSIPLQK